MRTFHKVLTAARYDLVLNAHGLVKSVVVALLAKGKLILCSGRWRRV